uniref:Glutamate--tRNA ligase n=1 Tax=Azospirillum brasilense TaxID=192 RepID=SYE_AZOBR|nr:RecName: Full=Glutamate--tRNA ligase; AltName: Full=Glutamyl-tRNA synthetase; Short=GluRS [Azospirillum brasilense]CAA67900.1 glutamine tRNA synthase [Azospirillum brasilense]
MSVAVPFAPSPTGLLHVGNVRLALVNWLFARKAGGNFLVRLDDTDEERSKPEYAEGIERDLTWLGLTWDRFARESDRYGATDEVAAALKASGRLYPCYETPEELNLKRASLSSQGRPPIYDRAALRLGDADRARLEAEGRKPHWRFKLEHTPVEWTDLVRGPVHFEGSALSDPVLIAEDGRPLYTLTSVVDDADLAITHVIRGEDHLANTAVQIQIFEAVGGAVPVFAHLPLLTDATGQGLSKRLGSLSVASLREEEGIEPMALASLLAKLGTSDAIEPRLTLDELVAEFDIAKVSRATPKFDPEELLRLNARILHLLPFERVAGELAASVWMMPTPAFWEAVPNLSRVAEARDWWAVTHAPVARRRTIPLFLAEAATLLPKEPWDLSTWGTWTGAVKAKTGRKGKDLFLPLRRALTGRDHGGQLKNLLPLIGRTRAHKRLAGETA